jgi:RNA polymerase sigma-70 factor (ECF subfamily)
MGSLDGSKSTHGSTDSQLIRSVQAHDSEGWRQLVRVYNSLVRYWIHCRVRLREDEVEDLLQDVFLTLARTIVAFQSDGNPASFRRWLRSVTNSRLNDFFRRSRKNVAAAVGGSAIQDQLCNQRAPDADEGNAAEERWLLLQHALERARLDFETRTFEAAHRVLVEERSVADVAVEMGLTAKAVRVYKSRLLRRLREILDETRE